MNRARMGLHRDIFDEVHARGAAVMAMTVGADPVSAVKAALIAITGILTNQGVSRRTFGGATGGVRDRGDQKHGGD